LNNKGAKEHDDAWPSREAAVNYTEAFPEEIEQALFEHAAKDFKVLKRMLPERPGSRRLRKSRNAQASCR